MCSGLILTDYNFHIRRAAEAYLVGRSQKWDHALAVMILAKAELANRRLVRGIT
jgi:hypothetical protein